jgi:hypothetical protein
MRVLSGLYLTSSSPHRRSKSKSNLPGSTFCVQKDSPIELKFGPRRFGRIRCGTDVERSPYYIWLPYNRCPKLENDLPGSKQESALITLKLELRVFGRV